MPETHVVHVVPGPNGVNRIVLLRRRVVRGDSSVLGCTLSVPEPPAFPVVDVADRGAWTEKDWFTWMTNQYESSASELTALIAHGRAVLDGMPAMALPAAPLPITWQEAPAAVSPAVPPKIGRAVEPPVMQRTSPAVRRERALRAAAIANQPTPQALRLAANAPTMTALRVQRESLGIGQRAVAQRLGISRRLYQAAETGSRTGVGAAAVRARAWALLTDGALPPPLVPTCPICHQEFRPAASWQRYCSPRCRNVAKQRRQHREIVARQRWAATVRCPVCHQWFTRERAIRRYCGRPCQITASNQAAKDRRQADRDGWFDR